MATFEKPRIVVEQSPWQGMLESLPDTLLNLYSLNKQYALEMDKIKLSQDFATTSADLAFNRQIYLEDKRREAELEDTLSSLMVLPPRDQTPGASELISMEAAPLAEKNQETGNRIDELLRMKSQQEAGIRDIEGLQTRFAGIIEAGKDDAIKDYMITGGLEIDPATGEPVGSDEWEAILNKLKTGTPSEQAEYEKFRSEAYISGIEGALRTMEEAQNLYASGQAIESAGLQQQASRTAIDANNFALFQAKHEEFETITGEIFKNQAVNFTAQFRYDAYSMMDLVALGAADPQALIDIKEEFMERYPSIAHDADKFLSGVQQAQANQVDPSRFVVQFYAKAYEDFLLLDEYRAELEKEGDLLNMDYQEMYANLPAQGAVKLEIDRLTKKVNGFTTLGVYGSGNTDELNHMFAITKMYDEQQAMRLTADVEEHERVAGYGLELDELESYYPDQYTQMMPKERIELEQSLAFISASGGDPQGLGGDIETFIQDIEETELAEEKDQEKYKTASDEYKYALSDFKTGNRSGRVFSLIIDDMYKKGMIQGTKGRFAPGPQIPEGYHFTEEEMAAIKEGVMERARSWRTGGGGMFGVGPNDAIVLLQTYQRFEDAWREYNPLWQGRTDSKRQIMKSLERL